MNSRLKIKGYNRPRTFFVARAGCAAAEGALIRAVTSPAANANIRAMHRHDSLTTPFHPGANVVDTKDLVELLSSRAGAVASLPSPTRRMAVWLSVSGAYVAGVVAIHGLGSDWLSHVDSRIVIEQIAMLATALTAALAAFSSVVPGRDRRLLWLPLVPLAVWLASLGEACIHDWLQLGSHGIRLRADVDCAVPAIVMSIVPGAMMILMLRRGAPLIPRITLSLGMLAAAAIVNLALRTFHLGDVSIMVLCWHVGGAALLTAIARQLGPRVLSWHSAWLRSGATPITAARR